MSQKAFAILKDLGSLLANSVKLKDINCLDSEGNEISFDTQLSIITHYFKNQDTNYDKSYEQATTILKSWFGDKYEESCNYNVGELTPLQQTLFKEVFDAPFPGPAVPKFTFIDLFAGIGGFRMALQNIGGKCVFSSEWNEPAKKTYFANYGDVPFGDITAEQTKSFIPNEFDILCAGFPCQPFSIAGVSKKKSLGRETGFRDKTQGTLFFDVAEIISRKRPKVFFLENVKNLLSHDNGYTFQVIKSTLEELEYTLYFKVLDGKDFVPQHRERILLVGFDKRYYKGEECFKFPIIKKRSLKIKDILDENVDDKYTLSDKLWLYLQNYAAKHQAAGNGFGYSLVDLEGISRTLSARYYKDGSEILIPQIDKNPRRLTPRECARLMGYPDQFIINAVSDVQAYRQCGNSVVMPLIQAVGKQIYKTMSDYERAIR